MSDIKKNNITDYNPHIALLKNPRNINTKSCTSNNNTIVDNPIDINYILTSEYFKDKYILDKVLYSCKTKIIAKLSNHNDDTSIIIKVHIGLDDYENNYKIFNILQLVKSKYIIKHIDLLVKEKYWCEIYEYFDGYNLKEYIESVTMDINDIMYIFMQIVQGIHILHNNNIIHCDIKLQNIMINNNKQIKIIDFDLSKITSDYHTCDYIFGTFEYISPESYDLCIHSKKSDVWELGILLYYLIAKEFPYDNDDIQVSNSYEHLYRRNMFKYPNMEKICEIIKKKNLSNSVYVLISQLLEFKDYNRLSVEEILKFKI